MSSKTPDQLIRDVDSLTMDEQLRLAAYAVERARLHSTTPSQRKWSDLLGIVEGLETGEDAQEWVTRTRIESDAQRDLNQSES